MLYLIFGAAIALETAGTTFLQRSEQFTRVVPTIGMACCYIASFFLLSLVLKTIPVGIAYAIWSAVGIVLISAVGVVFLGQRLDLPAIIGIGFIVAGVVIVNTLSKASVH